VARDHEHFLGNDIAGIAGQKAGIMRRGVPCLSAAQHPEAAAALDQHAAATGTYVAALARDIAWEALPQGGFTVDTGAGRLDMPSPSLIGPHQQANAALAVAALKEVRPDLCVSQLASGLKKARWPGRLQELPEGPLRDMIGAPVWIDGAHNAHGAAALAAALPLLDDGKWHFICGALDTRPPGEFLSRIAPHAASIRCVAIPDQPASLSAEALATAAADLFPGARTAPSVAGALQSLADGADDERRPVMICGSLYLAGHVLAANGSYPE